MTDTSVKHRLTQYAHGGGCACKIPPDELESMVSGLLGDVSPQLLVGLDSSCYDATQASNAAAGPKNS